MIWIPGGTFRMGSDQHYPEESPAHRVTVDGFWMDRHPVTNRQFREFVRATRHVTVAEIAPEPRDYPGMLPHMVYAGSLMFSPPAYPVSLRDFSQWWTFAKGADWRHPYGPNSNIHVLDHHPVVHVAFRDAVAIGSQFKTLMGQGGSIGSASTAYIYDWNMLPIGQALWLKELESYIPYPPLQDPASYNLEQVMQQIRQAKVAGRSD